MAEAESLMALRSSRYPRRQAPLPAGDRRAGRRDPGERRPADRRQPDERRSTESRPAQCRRRSTWSTFGWSASKPPATSSGRPTSDRAKNILSTSALGRSQAVGRSREQRGHSASEKSSGGKPAHNDRPSADRREKPKSGNTPKAEKPRRGDRRGKDHGGH